MSQLLTSRLKLAKYLFLMAGLLFLLVLAIQLLISMVTANNNAIEIEADIILDGEGLNIDSLAFWSGGEAGKPVLYVTAQDNNLVEIWPYPFTEKDVQVLSLPTDSLVNGIVVDEKQQRLYITVADEKKGLYQVQVYSLPGLKRIYEFGSGIIGQGETNLALLHGVDLQTRLYVTDDHTVYIFSVEENSAKLIGQFMPQVSEIETLLADDFNQLIYLPDERGGAGINPGIHVFDADGNAFYRHGLHIFGQLGYFQADAEGIALYRCLDENGRDLGKGWIVVSDQRQQQSEFEIFDRVSWAHVGQLRLVSVNKTDGISIFEPTIDGYPQGVFAAVDDDQSVAVIAWDKILKSLSLACPLTS